MSAPDLNDDEDEPGVWARYRWPAIFVLLVALGAALAWRTFSTAGAPSARPERITMVTLPPPPPKAVPTPPPVQPPPETKPQDSKPRMDDAPKAEAPKPEPVKPDEPPPTLGSNIKGAGNDGFGLSGSGNGGRVGFGGNGHGGGSPYGTYTSQIRLRAAEALRRDRRTRAGQFNLKVKLWLDEDGRITRVEPGGEDGPGGALLGQRVADRIPAGMPMPVPLQLVAQRPN